MWNIGRNNRSGTTSSKTSVSLSLLIRQAWKNVGHLGTTLINAGTIACACSWICTDEAASFAGI